jgi:hypothetical protein
MPATQSEVRLKLRDGRTLEAEHDSGIPERDLALQGRKLRSKFERVAPLSAAGRKAVAEHIDQLEQLPDLSGLHEVLARQ